MAFDPGAAGRRVDPEWEDLADAIWPDSFVTDDSLVQCTVELRRALHDPEQQIIKTIPRRGYLFASAVTESNRPISSLVGAGEPAP